MAKKFRLSSVDVSVLCNNLRSRIIGNRLANVYDLSDKRLVLKFYTPAAEDAVSQKTHVLIENGVRIHVTNFVRENPPIPKSFTMKLRKHVKSHRLTNVIQIGQDRVLCLIFGEGDRTHHLLVELYDRGNVILTDKSWKILSMFRAQQGVKAGDTYSVGAIRDRRTLTQQDLDGMFLKEANQSHTYRNLLVQTTDYGPTVISSALRKLKIGMGAKVSSARLTPFIQTELLKMLEEVDGLLHTTSTEGGPGYIIVSTPTLPGPHPPVTPTIMSHGEEAGAASAVVQAFEEFAPFLLPWETRPAYKMTDFNEAIDVFFSLADWMKESATPDAPTPTEEDTQPTQPTTRAERLEADQLKRINASRDLAATLRAQGLSLQMAAVEIRDMPAVEEAGWGVAGVDPETKMATIQVPLFADEDDGDGEGEGVDDEAPEEPPAFVTVTVDPTLSSGAIVSGLFAEAKREEAKATRTEEAMHVALQKMGKDRSTEGKKGVARGAGKPKQTHQARVRAARPKYWFEQFHWFISSDGILVVGGKDAQQNEALVKAHCPDTAVYMHAEVIGASSVVFDPRSPTPPPTTVSEAAMFASLWSSSWDHKALASVYWVWGHQVSKTAPTGEFVPTGAFMVRGTKNYVKPAPYNVGVGILFRVDSTSAAAHAGEHVLGAVELTEEQARAALDRMTVTVEERVLKEIHFDAGPSMTKGRGKVKKGKRAGGGKKEVVLKEAVEEDKDDTQADPAPADDITSDLPLPARRRSRKGRMAEYGGSSDDEPRPPKALTKAQRRRLEKKGQVDPTPDPTQPEVCVVCGSTEHLASDCPRRHDKPRVSKREKARQAKLMAPEAADDDVLATLTGRPTAEDVVISALPVVGPYSALERLPVVCRLKFGKVKKSQLGKEIVSGALATVEKEEAPAHVVAALRGIEIDDVVRGLPGGAVIDHKR